MACRLYALAGNRHKRCLIVQLPRLVLAEVKPARIVVQVETAVAVCCAPIAISKPLSNPKAPASLLDQLLDSSDINGKLCHIRIELVSFGHVVA